MEGGTSHLAHGPQGLGRTDFTEKSCRWPALREYLLEKHLPVAVTGF